MPTFTQIANSTFTGGPIAAAAAPGFTALVNAGLQDVYGNQVALDGSNNLFVPTTASSKPWQTNLFIRPSKSEYLADSQWRVYFTGNTTTNAFMFFTARIQNLGPTLTAYQLGLRSGTTAGAYVVTTGTQGSALTGGTTTGSFTQVNGTGYYMVFSISGNSPTTLQMTLFNLSNTQLGQYTVTDSTAALQNVTGPTGLCFNNNNAGPYLVSQIIAYSDAAATSYTVTGIPATVTPFQTYTGTVSLTGGATLTSNLVVTPSSALGSTISPTTETITAGSTTQATFSYTPTSTGTDTLSFTHTGGNSGMSDPSSQTITSAVTYVQNSLLTSANSPTNADSAPGGIGAFRTQLIGNPAQNNIFYAAGVNNLYCGNTSGFNVGDSITLDSFANQETLTVSAQTSTYITVTTTLSHNIGARIVNNSTSGWSDLIGNNYAVNQKGYIDGPIGSANGVSPTPWNTAPFVRNTAADLNVNSQLQTYFYAQGSLESTITTTISSTGSQTVSTSSTVSWTQGSATTTSSAITVGANTVTVAAIGKIAANVYVIVGSGTNAEYVKVTSISGSTFNATFKQAHSSGVQVVAFPYIVDTGAGREYIAITTATGSGTSFTATFANTHASGVRIHGNISRDIVHMHRFSTSGGNTTCYSVGYSPTTGNFYMYPVTAGVPTAMQQATAYDYFPLTSPAVGYTPITPNYILTTSCGQLSSGTATFTVTLAAGSAPGTPVASATFTDSTSSLASGTGTAGYCGVYYDGGTANRTPIFQIATYSGSVLPNATSVKVQYPAFARQNVAVPIGFALGGGQGLPNGSIVASLTANHGGTFSPTSVTIPNGQYGYVTTNYTPLSGFSGTETITISYTNVTGITVTNTLSVNVEAAFLDMANTATYVPPMTWVTGTTTNSLQTWRTGAYAKFFVTATGNFSMALHFDNTFFAGSQATVRYIVDDGSPSPEIPVYTLPNGILQVLNYNGAIYPAPTTTFASGAHKVKLEVSFISECDGRFQPGFGPTGSVFAGLVYCGLQGLGLTATGVANPSGVSIGSKFLDMDGDSISEGYIALTYRENPFTQISSFSYSHAYLFAKAYERLGYEYRFSGIGGEAFAAIYGNGGVPPFWDPTSSNPQLWNSIDSTHSSLSSGSYIRQPDVFASFLGVNDALYGNTGAALTPTLASRITSLLQAQRAAAGTNAKIFMFIPNDYNTYADISAGVTGAADALVFLENVNTSSTQGLAIEAYFQGLHPNAIGQAYFGALEVGLSFQQSVTGSSAATGYYISIPSAAVAGTTYNCAVVLEGGNSLATTAVFTITSTLGSTIGTATIASGSNFGTFTYKASSTTGTDTIGSSYTGGNGGMTPNGTSSVTISSGGGGGGGFGPSGPTFFPGTP